MSSPMLSGTLDFDSLDLAMLTQLFEPDKKLPNSDTPKIATDVRISAKTASFGALSLNNVAASLQNSSSANTLDIHDATAFGGTLQMSLKKQSGTGAKTELRILADDIETKSLEILGLQFTGLPQARASLSAIFHAPQSNWDSFFEEAEGTVKVRLGAGTMPGLNANQMVRALRKGGFFALKAEAPSVLSFTELNAEASLAQGTLQFNPLRIGLDKAALLLTGTYAVKDQSIALTGALDLEKGHAEAPNGAESLKVFFGGNRDTPLMSGLQ
jgi:AsmA protein